MEYLENFYFICKVRKNCNFACGSGCSNHYTTLKAGIVGWKFTKLNINITNKFISRVEFDLNKNLKITFRPNISSD